MVESPSGLVGVHWKVANPAASVTASAVGPGGAGGQHPVERARRRGGRPSRSSVHPTPGTASSRVSGSGVGS